MQKILEEQAIFKISCVLLYIHLLQVQSIAFFLFSFLEKQEKFFSNEKNRKNRYKWRFEARAKRVLQISHE